MVGSDVNLQDRRHMRRAKRNASAQTGGSGHTQNPGKNAPETQDGGAKWTAKRKAEAINPSFRPNSVMKEPIGDPQFWQETGGYSSLVTLPTFGDA